MLQTRNVSNTSLVQINIYSILTDLFVLNEMRSNDNLWRNPDRFIHAKYNAHIRGYLLHCGLIRVS